jgi:hypothetical protein
MTKISNQYSLTNVLTADVVNGRVGIGTETPTNKLTISNNGNSAIAFRINDTNANASFLSFNASNTDAAIIAGGTAAIPFDIYTGGIARFRIASDGITTFTNSIGMGGVPVIDAGDLKIQINGSTYGTLNLKSTSVNGVIRAHNPNGLLYVATSSNHGIAFVTNDAERMQITSGGNVGIGTTTPLNKFTVVGVSSFQLSDANDIRLIINPTASGINISGTYNVNGSYQPITISTSDTERMRITSGGKVLIGTTTDNSTGNLQVNGDISGYGGVNSRGVSAGLFTQSRSSADMMGWYSENITYLYFFHTSYGATGRITAASGVYTAISDVNKKKNFEQSNIGLNEVMQLKPTLYHLKTDDDSSPKELGFIAQEVKELIPQAYSESEDGSGTFIGLNQMPLIAALTKAIQELSADLTSAKQEIELLKAK